MIYEQSSGAVIFSINNESSKAEFLLLHYTSGHWDFPKGNIEFGEDEVQAAYREILEETGIQNVHFLEGFRKKIQYRYRRGHKLIQKEVIFYLGMTNTREIILSNEHIGYAWKNYDEAMNQLTYKSAKNLLTEVKMFLEMNAINNEY
jgi:8-oxo-dGTP pyrophosphatase MutT (NUDIX family)